MPNKMMPGVNPMELVKMIRQGSNPQQLLMNIMEQQIGSTPIGQNLIALAKDNRAEEIEKIARNITRERGVDFDEAFNAFKEAIGVK